MLRSLIARDPREINTALPAALSVVPISETYTTRADTFQAWPKHAELYGADYCNRAKSSSSVHAYAMAGGIDTARPYGSPANDVLVATSRYSKLSGDGSLNRAVSLEQGAYRAADGEADVAVLHDAVFEALGSPPMPSEIDRISWLHEFEQIRQRSAPHRGGDSITDAVDEVFAAYW